MQSTFIISIWHTAYYSLNSNVQCSFLTHNDHMRIMWGTFMMCNNHMMLCWSPFRFWCTMITWLTFTTCDSHMTLHWPHFELSLPRSWEGSISVSAAQTEIDPKWPHKLTHCLDQHKHWSAMLSWLHKAVHDCGKLCIFGTHQDWGVKV